MRIMETHVCTLRTFINFRIEVDTGRSPDSRINRRSSFPVSRWLTLHCPRLQWRGPCRHCTDFPNTSGHIYKRQSVYVKESLKLFPDSMQGQFQEMYFTEWIMTDIQDFSGGTMKILCTIGGFDPTSGAGVSADIKTAHRAGIHAVGVITSVTAQNTKEFISASSVPESIVSDQLASISDDFDIGAIKLSMIGAEGNIQVIIDFIKKYPGINVVWDPVITSTTGGSLNILSENWNSLFSLSSLVTPNSSEILHLMDSYPGDPVKSAQALAKTFKTSVLLKSVPSWPPGTDILFSDENQTVFSGDKIDNREIHGTGCALSTLIACALMQGDPTVKAIENARLNFANMRKDVFQPSKGSWLFR